MSNCIGTIFKVVTFGESHGRACGALVDGCPAGVPLTVDAVRAELARRRGGAGDKLGFLTTRREPDEPEILSGIYEGKTLGTPIAIIMRNLDVRREDYDALKDLYRPGHADWCWEAKYGLRDHSGGGRASGRETAGRVAAGAVAKAFLTLFGVSFKSSLVTDTNVIVDKAVITDNAVTVTENHAASVTDTNTAADGAATDTDTAEDASINDSIGCIAYCRVDGLPPGLGEPVFGKLDAEIARAILSIGAVKGIEFGAGFASAKMRGSEHNDPIIPGIGAAWEKNLPPNVPAASFASNKAGGVLGGISNGMPLEFRAAIKPVPSIKKEQRTIDRSGSPSTISVSGRHDVCIGQRALVVIEAMTAIVLADLLLQNRAARF